MGVINGLKGFGMGLAADVMMGGMTGGMCSLLFGIAGLFRPDAGGMEQAHDRSRYGKLGAFEPIFGNTEGKPNDPRATSGRSTSIWKTVGAAVLGFGLLTGVLGNFGLPLYYAGLLPYNAGGLVPLAWSNGILPSWGWSAGFIPGF
jgi:hypothetical protein